MTTEDLAAADHERATADPDQDRYVVSRTLAASPSAVFALLTDPARHHETEPTDWVRGPLETDPAPLTEVGQVFGIEMFHVNAGGRYDMHNRVIALEQDRVVAWEPGQYGPDGDLGTGGWTWRYDLAPAGDAGTGTEVTLTYDWSRVPGPVRDEFGLPPFPPAFLEDSLAALERAPLSDDAICTDSTLSSDGTVRNPELGGIACSSSSHSPRIRRALGISNVG